MHSMDWKGWVVVFVLLSPFVHATLTVPAGGAASFPLTLQNNHSVAIAVNVSVNGATVSGRSEVSLQIPAHQNRTVELRVTAPAHAVPGSSIPVTYMITQGNFSPVNGTITATVASGPSSNNHLLAALGILLAAALVVLVIIYTRRTRVPKDAFVSHGGYATTLQELATLIDSMPEEALREHLSLNGNEIANWAYYKTRDAALYRALRDARDRQTLLQTLLGSL